MARTIRFRLDECCDPAIADGLRRRSIDVTSFIPPWHGGKFRLMKLHALISDPGRRHETIPVTPDGKKTDLGTTENGSRISH